MSYRKFLIGLFLAVFLGFMSITGVMAQALPTLDPTTIPKYSAPLVIPPAMPARVKSHSLDYYEIAVRQFQQQILPGGMPLTTVWSYGPAGDVGPDNTGLHVTQGGRYFYPAFTIEAEHKKPVRVKWINELKDGNGNYRPHLLPVDQTLHWANPPGGKMGRDMRPMFMATPGPYTGPVPIVTHLHGAVAVGDESDGYAEAWYLPAANNIPAGFATEGTWYDFFKIKALIKFLHPWNDGYAVFQYPNKQRASTLWYHDHTLGMTRLNVYAGPAGFYLIRGGSEDLDLGYNPPSRTLGAGVNPGTITEIPIAIQDRSFNGDGSLFYPDSRGFFGDVPPGGPFIPFSDISPIWNPEFFGNTMVVNGQTWPFLQVEQRRYRFRILNGCNSRFLILDFNALIAAGAQVWQIGNEGGFLPAPLDISTLATPYQNRILLGLAERADVIVDFTNVPEGYYVLGNVGPDEPFGGGIPVIGCDPNVTAGCFEQSDPDTTGQVMQFRVVVATAADPTTPPQNLILPAIAELTGGNTKPLALLEMMSMSGFDAPAEAMLGTMSGGVPTHKMWMSPITENPKVGETQVWEFYNFTADAHPIHIHEVHFQVVDRQRLVLNDLGEVDIPVSFDGEPIPPEVWEDGAFKDTVISYPGEVVRVRAKFDVLPGLFVWHCHIVEHEDNEMMRPYFIGGTLAKLPYDFYIKKLGRDLF
jgi:FtsP/CotA-like multicopper oxidase with cupredoxin domain